LAIPLLLAAICALWSAGAAALVVVTSGHDRVYGDVIQGLHAGLPPDTPLETRLASAPDLPAGEDPVVAIGTRALAAVLRQDTGRPVLAVLVPRQSLVTLVQRGGKGHGPVSALYLDQPLDRQLRAARAVFPSLDRAGVLLHDDATAAEYAEDPSAVRELTVVHVNNGRNAIRAVGSLAKRIDFLIAVPDSRLYNRRTIHGILLGSYRLNLPLIGYSRSVVRAGALISTWLPPRLHGREAATMLAPYLDGQTTRWPISTYTRSFRIAINVQVARSLRLEPAIPNATQRTFDAEAPIR